MYRPKFYRLMFLCAVILNALIVAHSQTSAAATDWNPVEEAMGRTGQVADEVIRFAMPRKDLHVTLGGVEIKPALALGSWGDG